MPLEAHGLSSAMDPRGHDETSYSAKGPRANISELQSPVLFVRAESKGTVSGRGRNGR